MKRKMEERRYEKLRGNSGKRERNVSEMGFRSKRRRFTRTAASFQKICKRLQLLRTAATVRSQETNFFVVNA
jgi:hypothetical protein